MTGFRIEFRRGPGLWAAPILCLAGVLVAHSQIHDLSVWTYVTAGVAGAPLLMAPLAAGVAVWAGSRPARSGTIHMQVTAARVPLAGVVAELTALLAWTLISFGALVCGFFLVCATRATWGGPSWPWLGVAALGLVVAVIAGYVVGRALPYRFTPLGVALVVFLIGSGVGSHTESWTSLLSPASSRVWLPFGDLRALTLVGQAVWNVGLIVLGLLAAALLVRASRRVIGGFAALAGAALVCGGLVLQGQGPSFTTFRDLEWTCRGQAPQVCVHPAFESAFPEVTRRADQVAAGLAGTPFAITRVEQRPRGPRWAPTPGAVSFGLDGDTPADLTQAASEMAAGAIGYTTSCFSSDGPPPPGLRTIPIILAWVIGEPDRFEALRPEEVQASTWFNALNEQARKAWISSHANAISTCSLTFADFHAADQ